MSNWLPVQVTLQRLTTYWSILPCHLELNRNGVAALKAGLVDSVGFSVAEGARIMNGMPVFGEFFKTSHTILAGRNATYLFHSGGDGYWWELRELVVGGLVLHWQDLDGPPEEATSSETPDTAALVRSPPA